MKRFHEELPLLVRRARVARLYTSSITGKTEGRSFKEKGRNSAPLGVFRKRKPYDCGQARCMLCHGQKLLRKGEARTERDAWRHEMTAGGYD